MDLEGCTVVAYLNNEGFAELVSLFRLPDRDAGIPAVVTGADNFGLWLSFAGEQWARTIGTPWRYFSAVELVLEPEGETTAEIRRHIGFRG
jgi:hypothetical protein